MGVKCGRFPGKTGVLTGMIPSEMLYFELNADNTLEGPHPL